MRQGLREAHVEAALGDLDRADLPAKTVAALRLVDLLSVPNPVIDTATYQRLREHLDDRELLELGAALSIASGWQRFIEAFGIRPDRWTEALPPPRQEGGLGREAGAASLSPLGSVRTAGGRPCPCPGRRARYDGRGVTAVAPAPAAPTWATA